MIYLDTETYNEVPIQDGTYKYAENCEIIMWQWAIDDGPIQVSETLTEELRAALTSSDTIVIHNSMFDRTVIRYCMGIDIAPERVFDTMACALSISLPGSLDKLCHLFGISEDLAKDKNGPKLINLFCKPHQTKDGIVRYNKQTHPEEWEMFVKYGKNDISAMRELYKKLPKWNYRDTEKEIWNLDQKINDRGILIDRNLASSAVKTLDKAKTRSDKKISILTYGTVDSITKRDRLLSYIEDEYGVLLEELSASSVEKFLESNEDLPSDMIEILRTRLLGNKASVSKYKRVLKGINNDSRLRGSMQFCGASRTGRWAGRLFQPHNLPRGTIHGAELESGIQALLQGNAIEEPYELCSSALRGLIIPEENNKIIVSDWSNIEGRVLAWLAGEEWKIKAFKDFDAGMGHDLYNLTYARTFGVPVESVTKAQRQIGKVEELAFGYQGSLGACITFAAAYNLDLEGIAAQISDTIPNEVMQNAREFISWYHSQKKSTYGLSDDAAAVWISVNRMWRAEHQNICWYWRNLEDACSNAVLNPGKTFKVGFHQIQVKGSWLRISLPSSRWLCYPRPRLTENGKISYYDPRRKGERNYTYGGKIAENITQAVARDILGWKMLDVEDAGYKIILTVHDEILAETPTDKYSERELSAIMGTNPPWSMGLPLAATGFECNRYRKD